jgi:glycosyltransferase involved in cell wall biosynthesis
MKMRNKKIKILRIITRLNVGGPAIHVALLTKELNNTDFESALIYGSTSKDEGDMNYILGGYSVNSTYIPALTREISPFRDALAFWRIFKFMKEYRPDIVHTHTAKAGTLGRIAAMASGVPVKVHTFHGNVFYGYFNRLLTGFFIFIERMLARFTDAIVTISEAQRYEIVEKYKITDSDKCHVIKLGFELQKFLDSGHKRDILRKKLKFNEDDILVGTVGRLAAIKNHKMLIDAVDYVNKNGNDQLNRRIRYVVIGDGELRNELLQYIKGRNLGESISLIGWVKDIDEVYAGIDIAALTSVNEGTPVSLIEAMASSRPVISTDVGGVKDAVGAIGLLVKSGDYKAMGDKILELARSAEKRESLGKTGRDFIKKRFSKERLVSELKELYSNLIRARSQK